MSEPGVKSNEREAVRLLRRGMAAARGGQRRVAAVLLSRAVQLDPGQEHGWLWLSGVLDEPNEIAFCLRSVLSVNPHNERARQGLAWLEQRALIPIQPAPSAIVDLHPEGEEHADERQARHEGESWWVNWRRSRRDMSRVRLVFWSIPLLLLLLTLGLNLTLRDAVARNSALAGDSAPPVPQALATNHLPAPILQSQLAAARDAQALAYLSAMDGPRASLREAIQAYKGATNQPGGSSVGHAAAARKLREQIETATSAITGMTPPTSLAQAHADYLAGLELERAALGDMLEFYNSFSISIANRATLRLEDAGKRLEHARARMDAHRTSAAGRVVAPQTAR